MVVKNRRTGSGVAVDPATPRVEVIGAALVGDVSEGVAAIS